MAMTLKDIKIKWRYKAESKMNPEELKFFNSYKKKHREESNRLHWILETYNRSSDNCKITLPMFVPMLNKNVPDKKIAVNMNWYRNVNFIINDNVKKEFKRLVGDYINKLKKATGKIHVEYTVYYDREPDGMNVVSIVSKYFLDALQDYWIIKDDKISIVTESYLDWWQCKWGERVEVKIIHKT